MAYFTSKYTMSMMTRETSPVQKACGIIERPSLCTESSLPDPVGRMSHAFFFIRNVSVCTQCRSKLTVLSFFLIPDFRDF